MEEKEARKFVHDWLWSSEKRTTSGEPWPFNHVVDAALMVIDATADLQTRLTTCQRELEAARGLLSESAEHFNKSDLPYAQSLYKRIKDHLKPKESKNA